MYVSELASVKYRMIIAYSRMPFFPPLVPSSSFLVSFSFVQYDPRYTSRPDNVSLGSCNSRDSAIYSNEFPADHTYAYARTYAHMYADICVYIPVPVPVQRTVIRGRNDKKPILSR